MDEQHPVPDSNRTYEGRKVGAEIGKLKVMREKLAHSLNWGQLRDGKFQTVNDSHATVDRTPSCPGPGSNLGLLYTADTQAMWDPHLGVVFEDPECLKSALEAREEYSI